ncbi:hypothetical protein BGZ95_008798 [Linnemannia exigua]|uniref:Uncharacterized protein n=1 Tax=Linnemannia exigua TaxID=604196 RepID=A0AAD4DDT0_9FUNG|nr:hypothetical protein BGZ95_008798 [Linnemannia exigua]
MTVHTATSPTPSTVAAKLPQLASRRERIDLGDGLVMRWSTAEDKDALIECHAYAFQFETMGRTIPEGQLPGKNEYVTALTARLMTGQHPLMTEYDFALVEDTNILQAPKPGQTPRPLVVAATCLMLVSGFYGSIDMGWGIPEAVGTRPEYRGRGLVKRLFLDMIHPAAEARGDLMLLIAGIPYFYKQFGYENGVPATSFRHLKNVTALYPPSLPNKRLPRFTLREATSSDLPYLVRLSQPNRLFSKAKMGTYYDLKFWTFVVETLARENIYNYYDAHHHAAIVVDSKTGKDVGISLTGVMMFGGNWNWKIFSLDQDQMNDDEEYAVTYRDAMASVLSQLKEFDRPYYECYSAKLNNNTLPLESETTLRTRNEFPAHNFTNISIGLPPTHPVTLLLDSRKQIDPAREPYRFYTRIPSLPKFLLKIAPVLEERVKESGVWRDVSARLQVDFYQKLEGMSGRGLEVVLKRGKVVEANDWKPKSPEQEAREAVERFHARKQSVSAESDSEEKEDDKGEDKEVVLSAGLKPLMFTRLVTGETSLDELLKRETENYVGSGEAKLLLEVLFPAKDEFNLDLMWL